MQPLKTSVEFENFTADVDIAERRCRIVSKKDSLKLEFTFDKWSEIQAIFEHFGHQIPGASSERRTR